MNDCKTNLNGSYPINFDTVPPDAPKMLGMKDRLVELNKMADETLYQAGTIEATLFGRRPTANPTADPRAPFTDDTDVNIEITALEHALFTIKDVLLRIGHKL